LTRRRHWKGPLLGRQNLKDAC